MPTLLTLGCSWTEGYGAYLPELIEPARRNQISYKEFVDGSKDHMAKHSWPAQLADGLGYNLVNMGLGGDSNGGQARRLLTLSSVPRDCKLAIWLLTDPSRLSLYIRGSIASIHTPVKNVHKHFQKLADAYGEITENRDYILETAFYVSCVEEFLKNRGITLVVGTAWTHMSDLTNFRQVRHNLFTNSLYNSASEILRSMGGDELFAACRHPNEQGYQVIARYMELKLKEFRLV